MCQKCTKKNEKNIKSTKNSAIKTTLSMENNNYNHINSINSISINNSKTSNGQSCKSYNNNYNNNSSKNNNSISYNKPNNNNNTTVHIKSIGNHHNNEQIKINSTSMSTESPSIQNNVIETKMERSNSFSLRGKLSKLLSSITSSKDTIMKTDDKNRSAPYAFTRSRSMILLKRTNRRSLIEPQLEQLSEEGEKLNEVSLKSSINNSSNETKEISKTSENKCGNENRENYEKLPAREKSKCINKASLLQECDKNPRLNFQKRRSSTLIESFKSTFNGFKNTNKSKKESINPKWSASLHSLQMIDNMISYENMSFIDYDKLYEYDKHLERQFSMMSIRGLQQCQSNTIKNHVSMHFDSDAISDPKYFFQSTSAIPTSRQPIAQIGETIRQNNKSSDSILTQKASLRCKYAHGLSFDAQYEHNLDKRRNLYRVSLDSRKLEILNDMQNSFISIEKKFIDALNLECDVIRNSESFKTDLFEMDTSTQLKSKSLTHLDGLDSITVGQRKSKTVSKNTPNVTTKCKFFSVSFSNERGCCNEEFIPVSKELMLGNALSQALKKRNLTFSQITITDTYSTHSFSNTSSSQLVSSINENTKVESLIGHHLLINENDSSHKTLQKAASFGSRSRPLKLLSSASIEDAHECVVGNSKQTKQRWSGIFGIKDPHQNKVCELLNSFANNEISFNSFVLNSYNPDTDAAFLYLDNKNESWCDFVECDNMNDHEIKIQTAIWELVTTEIDYIHTLKTVTDLFLACLETLQDHNLLSDVDQRKLFSNVRDICKVNLEFWSNYLYPMVAHSILTSESLRWTFFEEGFAAFPTIFAPYKKYCAEQSICQFYCKELNRNNPLFTSYLAWCESQKMCNRLRLADILVRPMQRLTKYSLLLGAIKKHMSDFGEIEALDTMLYSVENFVYSVNNHLTMRQESERLKGVMARLESYDVVETHNEQLEKEIKQFSHMFDLCAPMKGCAAHLVRHLFMEGDHKFKDNLGKIDVHCFLLTDILLVCKTVAKKGLGALKVIRQPFFTDRLMVFYTSNINTLSCVYLNEFQMAITAFTLQSNEAGNWYEALRRAKLAYLKLKNGGITGITDSLGTIKSAMNSSICSRVSSTNNSQSGSVEWNDSRNVSIDFEKTNSSSSDEGANLLTGSILKNNQRSNSKNKLAIGITGNDNMLSVQPFYNLGQSLPNLNLNNFNTNNTLLVPGTSSQHSRNIHITSSHRGISYPPPCSPRILLRRGIAFSVSTKHPPLLKSRNINPQSSINWQQIPATPASVSSNSLSQRTSPKSINNEKSIDGIE